MIIRLENIKCYENKTFDLGKEGLALISGQSGKGKTSIVQGIYFCLFGIGNKIITAGKKSCKAEIEFDNIKISRTKNPSKLIVNDLYEDEEAQQIINKKFGKTFDVTGYISQNSLKSFILMSASEKLSFIERFAMSEVDLEKIKLKCKEEISEKHEQLIETTAKLETAIEFFEQIEEPEHVEFPLSVKNNNYEKSIKNENIRHKNTLTLIKKNKNTLTEISGEISTYNLLNVRLQEYYKQKKSLEDKRDNYEDEYHCLFEDYIGNDELKKLQLQLKNITDNRYLSTLKHNYETDKKNLEQLEQTEIDTMEEEFNKLNIWEEYSKEEVEEEIKLNTELLRDSERLYTLNNKLKKYENSLSVEDLKTEIEKTKHRLQNIKLQKISYKCPSCYKLLKFEKNKLILQEHLNDCENTMEEEEDIETYISNLEKILMLKEEIEKIEKLYEGTIPEPHEVKSDLKYLRDYNYNQSSMETKKISLGNKIGYKILSDSCISLRRKLKESEDEIKKLEKNEKIDADSLINEEDLLKKIDIQKTIKIKTDQLHEILNNILKEIKEADLNYENAKQTKNKHDYEELESKLVFTENEIKNLENKKIKHERNISQIEKWKKMKEKLKLYTTWENKISELQTEETKRRNEYSALCSLRETILEAESVAIINIVQSINEHAAIYLDAFFENEPITVELQAFKQVKKQVKAQININIQYKGNECDLSMLSGGETARVVLAYTLALAEMFNTPLLMLDECTASLDQETTDDVFEAIRENFKGKLTIIIAHQVVTGTFDKIINLSQ